MSLEEGKRNDKRVQIDEVLNNQRQEPLSLEDFRRFLEEEHAVENLEFYENVEQFKEVARDDDESSVDSRVELERSIADNYVAPGAPKEVNIEGRTRDEILQRVQNNEVDPDIFTPAQREVRNLMMFDSFSRFVKQSLSSNITKSHGNWRKELGVNLLLIGTIFSVATYLFTLFGLVARYLRIIPLPFFVGGYSYYVSGRRCLCTGLALRGVRMKEGETVSWFAIFSRKPGTEDKTVQDKAAERALRWQGQKLAIESFVFGIVVTAVLVALPPGTDIYPGLPAIDV